MDRKIIYPTPKGMSRFHRTLRKITRIVFVAAALICLIINYFVKGPAWSLVVVWSLYIAWKFLFSLNLVEFSIYSHTIHILIYILVLLWLIDRFLAPGMGDIVIPIVLFGIFVTMFILYFSIYDRKEKHLMSILTLGIIVVIMVPYYIHSLPITNWLTFAFLIASLVLFIMLVIISRKEILYELKVRFVVRDKQ